MATYCTVEDVQRMLPSITITNSSKINIEQVNSMIASRSLIIDTKIIRHYSLPITDASTLLILKVICEKMIAGEIMRILFAGSMKDVPDFAQRWLNEANELLNAIASGEQNIDSADSTDVVFTGKNDEDGNTREATFTRDGDIW